MDEERICETCRWWQDGRCENQNSGYVEMRMEPEETCDEWTE